MKPQAMFLVKRRSRPMQAVVVTYDAATGKRGKVLASETIRVDFANSDLIAIARRLVPQAAEYDVILPVGVDI